MEASVLDPKDAEAGIQEVKDREQPPAACADAPAHRISFVSASKMPEDEDAVLTSMCKLLASLLRVPATGDLSAPGSASYAWHSRVGKLHVLTMNGAAGVGMLNRGRLQYFGTQHPSDWQSLPNLAAVPLDSDLLVVKDTQQDCRSVMPASSLTLLLRSPSLSLL